PGITDPGGATGGGWSASWYVWHLVDVLRIGTERLLPLTHDPARGITCWDENALAEVRRYRQLSTTVGLLMLRSVAQAWITAAAVAPGNVQVRHPRFGSFAAVQSHRPHSHQVPHHLMDIHPTRCQRRANGGGGRGGLILDAKGRQHVV